MVDLISATAARLMPPYPVLVFGVFMFVLAVIYTCIGRANTKARWVYRGSEPRRYWVQIGIYYLGALVCILLFLHELVA